MSEIKPSDSAATADNGEEKDWAAAKAFFDNLKTNKPRPPKPRYAVTIAVSSRTLFNMVEERKIYEDEGVEKYVAHQVEHENEPLRPGAAFPFVKALMNVNSRLRELYPDSEELFDIVLMTNNHAQVGVRLINSINHYDLTIERFCMTGGKSPIGYLKAYMTNLYLSKDSDKVTEAIAEGFAPHLPESTEKLVPPSSPIMKTVNACDNSSVNLLHDATLTICCVTDLVKHTQ